MSRDHADADDLYGFFEAPHHAVGALDEETRQLFKGQVFFNLAGRPTVLAGTPFVDLDKAFRIV